MGKEEIACQEQLLLFPQCFQKACFPETSKGVIVWEWVNCEICDINSLINPSLDDKNLSLSKLQVFVYNKTFTHNIEFVLNGIENNVGKKI